MCRYSHRHSAIAWTKDALVPRTQPADEPIVAFARWNQYGGALDVVGLRWLKPQRESKMFSAWNIFDMASLGNKKGQPQLTLLAVPNRW
jgi:hypothetical protein